MIRLSLTNEDAIRVADGLKLLEDSAVIAMRTVKRTPKAIRSLDYQITQAQRIQGTLRASVGS